MISPPQAKKILSHWSHGVTINSKSALFHVTTSRHARQRSAEGARSCRGLATFWPQVLAGDKMF
jgi:hypothetical protein